MLQIKSYADMFQAINFQKILKIRFSSQNFLQNESFFSFSLKRFDLNYKSHIASFVSGHLYSSKHFIPKKSVCLLLIQRDNEISRFWQTKIEIGSHKEC